MLEPDDFRFPDTDKNTDGFQNVARMQRFALGHDDMPQPADVALGVWAPPRRRQFASPSIVMFASVFLACIKE